MDLNLPFICCAVCQDNTQNTNGLYMTSCAHLLCKDHASRNALNPHHLESTKTTCPACGHDQVSLAKVDNGLQSEIRPFFTPFPTQVEQMFAAAQFQYCGMIEKIHYQSQTIEKLVEKVNKQKELLLMAKEKVSQIKDMENSIKVLESENKRLRASIHGHGTTKSHQAPSYPPPTVDLTEDSYGDEEPAQPQVPTRRALTKSFIDQVKKSSSQKAVPSLNQYKYSPQHTEDHMTMDLTRGRLAESTNILRESQRHYPQGTKPRQTPAFSTPSSNRPTTLSSNGSASSGSVTSRSGDFMLPTAAKTSSHQQPQSSQTNRVAKSRAATSQLAQRLSSHMKIGTGTTSRRIQSSTGPGQRPGTSFINPSPLFRKR